MSFPWRKRRSFEFSLLLIFLCPFDASTLPCDDSLCRTGSCDDNGACVCQLPDPSTIFDGDRPFFGGRLCDEKQIMCDGTNSFWCEHGATCNEIIQGENYTCICPPGYSGIHCEYIGAPCGRIFCFHGSECLIEGDLCDCPHDWRGSTDCSLPTKTDLVVNSTVSVLQHVETGGNSKWFAFVLTISCFLGVVAGAAILVKIFYQKREMTNVPKFQQLSHMQIHELLDDDDDSLIPQIVHNDNAHL